MKKVRITQIRSGIGRPQDQKDTLKCLNLRKMHQSVEVDMDDSAKAGMVEKVKHLLQTTKEALYLGIEQAVVGKRLGDIGNAVQQHCEKYGYGVVREFTGHGVGREMHEDPAVPNYGRRGNGVKLKSGMVIAIEPMITMKSRQIVFEDDTWGVSTSDGRPAAHFEHTVAIGQTKADILSSFDFVEEVLRNKQN